MTVLAPSRLRASHFESLPYRTPLEAELLGDLAGQALGDVEMALTSPYPRTALQLRFVERKERLMERRRDRNALGSAFDRAELLFLRAVENLAEEMLDHFIVIAEARRRRREERVASNDGS